MRAVFLDRSTISEDIDLSPIESHVTTISYFEHTANEKVIFRAKFAEIIISNKVMITAEIINQLPKLKLICIAATGTNNVDLVAAQKAGIAVCNVSGYANTAVTQYVFAMLLEYLQKTSHYIENSRHGHWQNSPVFCHFGLPINELATKKIAIIGYGALGKQVSKIAKAFAMEVLIAERKSASTIRPGRVSFEQAISSADIISLHAPLSIETENLINQQSIKAMQTGVIIINTARGGLVNSIDLLAALKSKKVGAAILDVLEHEPPAHDHPLLNAKLDNLLITAHIAWGSLQAQQRLINRLADNIKSYQQGVQLNRVV
ncbi:D-2-hydroxyacid dehydrogenase [Thalassotalea sp. ND16A]|uniref:D-2-hydroxyacid dehydrogenase n=1 Tax=Thalassotalea sp. ND16A TaxID=1535422 RepID=UPI00051A0A7D|nr:D-2-hydroxyacid dehydrogenase [Thalassotalea sp. ND16A]KGJ89376.1 Glycerate dehydrogenase [Thalassotalea sp. ND16A]